MNIVIMLIGMTLMLGMAKFSDNQYFTQWDLEKRHRTSIRLFFRLGCLEGTKRTPSPKHVLGWDMNRPQPYCFNVRKKYEDRFEQSQRYILEGNF